VAFGAQSHMIAVRLTLVRVPGAASDWKIDKRTAILPTAEVRLRDAQGAVYPGAAEYAGTAFASFDKSLEKGTAWLYFEVPNDLVCGTAIVEVADARVSFDKSKLPKGCR
jgi:hypothetical protein